MVMEAHRAAFSGHFVVSSDHHTCQLLQSQACLYIKKARHAELLHEFAKQFSTLGDKTKTVLQLTPSLGVLNCLQYMQPRLTCRSLS